MKIEINVLPKTGNVSVHEFDDNGKVKLITRGNSPQHRVFLKNVMNVLNSETDNWKVERVNNKVFAYSIQ